MTGSPAVTAIGGGPAPIVLVAHGSRDLRAAAATRALARAVAAAGSGTPVYASYLDHTSPRPGQVLRALQDAGHRSAVVVPLLLTAAYHRRVDVPEVIAAARADGLRIPVRLTEVLGPCGGVVDDLLLAGLRRRLAESVSDADAVVLAAAGTRDALARGTVAEAADALGATLGVPCLAAYASAAEPDAGSAVARLRAGGARRVAVASYFLAPGLLYETAARSARQAGAVAVAAPLWAAPELAGLVLRRAAAPAVPAVRAA
nr:CbiX/SirB N-terminal domain-containing protein [Micromonospora sp. DSM 115978]